MKFLALTAALAATTEGIRVAHKSQVKSHAKSLQENTLYHLISLRNDDGTIYDFNG